MIAFAENAFDSAPAPADAPRLRSRFFRTAMAIMNYATGVGYVAVVLLAVSSTLLTAAACFWAAAWLAKDIARMIWGG